MSPVIGLKPLKYKAILNPAKYYESLNLYKSLLRVAKTFPESNFKAMKHIRNQFRKNRRIKDPEIVNENIRRGYLILGRLMELQLNFKVEELKMLMQQSYKAKTPKKPKNNIHRSG